MPTLSRSICLAFAGALVLSACAPVGNAVDCSEGGERLYRPGTGPVQVVNCEAGTVRSATRADVARLGRG